MVKLFIRINLAREASWLESVVPQDYDGVVISSHIIENIPKHISKMLTKLKKPYIVDPYTYIFGGDVGNIREKSWFSSLLEKYGVDKIVDRDTLSLDHAVLVDGDGRPTKSLQELVCNVMSYQKNVIDSTVIDILEFIDFGEGEGTNQPRPAPYGIIPPYFFISEKDSEWLKVNISAVKVAINKRKAGEKIIGVIMINSDIMRDRLAVKNIVSAYNIDGIDEFMVWPAGMNEKTAERTTLESFKDFMLRLAQYGKPVTSIYGGLFPLLIQTPTNASFGTTHSICYGEHRVPFVLGGPAAVVMFYQRQVRVKIPLSARNEVESELSLNRCDCIYCADIKEGADSARLFELAGKHFLVCRMKEVKKINRAGTLYLLDEMAKSYEHAKQRDDDRVYDAYYKDYSVWKKILVDASKKLH